jgi:non-ribosomal peptide synthetase component F
MLDPDAVDDLPALRLLILGGETCSSQLITRWARPGLRIVNTYGPTETTVIATYADVFPDKPITIGRPVPWLSTSIFSTTNCARCRQDETGEICIGGAGVARGYRGLPDETDARFVPDPFAVDGEGARMYRSGDMGRLDGEGNIRFHGPRRRAGEAARLSGGTG